MSPPAAVAALYSDAIRERWRRPRRRGELAAPTATAEDVNPLCGDRVRLTVEAVDGQVGAVRFTGDACAICIASADVVAELAEGRTVGEALRLGTEEILGVLRADIRPTRMRCLTLPLSVLAAALGRIP